MHTPGPWQVDRFCEGVYHVRPFLEMADEAGLSDDAQTAIAINKEDKANANLIAAAPELLEACEIALDALGCDRVRVDRLEAQEIIHKAINKAKGG